MISRASFQPELCYDPTKYLRYEIAWTVLSTDLKQVNYLRKTTQPSIFQNSCNL